ncbi:protoheme IX farnesyltransferase [candidate division KSB1 bacterium]|nr:protoheme IX farnesyltransferase [candidate division KSB1 bacterium]
MFKKWLKIFFALIKIKISAAVSVTTAVGYLLAVEKVSLKIFIPMIGIFLLACGSSALNEFQEQKIDSLMNRTKDRPLPAKRIQTRATLFIILVLVLAGILVLYFGTNLLATLLGIFALVWYNGVYTPLKRKTAFAAVPGALIGAIPPLVGWVAGGGYIFNPKIMLIASFFFIWQVPHFWLLLLLSGDDYQRAGLPSLTGVFSIIQISRITFMWMLTTAMSSLIILNFGDVQSLFIKTGLAIAAIGLSWQAVKILRAQGRSLPFKYAFIRINVFALLVIVFLSIDKLMNVF